MTIEKVYKEGYSQHTIAKVLVWHSQRLMELLRDMVSMITFT